MFTTRPYAAEAVASDIHSCLSGALRLRRQASLAICGGRSPGPVLRVLASVLDDPLRQALHLLWVDERAVPRGDSLRNDKATLAAWAEGGPLPAHVHAMPAEQADLDRAARGYAGLVKQVTADGLIDCCLLSVGEDGHVASLFPGHPGLAALEPVIAVADSPKPPARRLTMSLGTLHHARERHVLILGEEKHSLLPLIATGPSREVPVSLLPKHGTVFHTDE